MVWEGVIRMESTEAASAHNTTQILYRVVTFVYPRVQPSVIEQVDGVLRKSGHFLGYGILSVLVFFALRNTNRDRLRPLLQRAWGSLLRDWWQWEWAVLGVLVTVVTASFDEMHQRFLASRTGCWQDVALDTCGAIILQVVVYLISLRALERRRSRLPQAQLQSTS